MPDVVVKKFSNRLDYSKYLYYLKGRDVIAYNKASKSKRVLVKNAIGTRKPKHRYYVKPINGGAGGFYVKSGPLAKR